MHHDSDWDSWDDEARPDDALYKAATDCTNLLRVAVDQSGTQVLHKHARLV
jgi:hypothetical protein